ncbi:MAG: hypothetical protein WBA34_05625 [Candidatus Deferrimicrobiaceae bacterium]
MKRIRSGILAWGILSTVLFSPANAQEKETGGYRLYEATAATVNGEVLFLSDVDRESCLRACGAFPGEEMVMLSLPEARDRLIADILVRQEEQKLALGTVDNTALQKAVAGALAAMESCPFPCAREVSGEQVRDYAARRLLVREFLRKRVSAFVDVKEEELERAVQRRASRSGVRPEDVPREAVRKELLEESSSREIRNWFDRATSKSKILLAPLEER